MQKSYRIVISFFKGSSIPFFLYELQKKRFRHKAVAWLTFVAEVDKAYAEGQIDDDDFVSLLGVNVCEVF